MFQVSLQDEESKVTADHVDEIIYEFHCSEKKKKIHQAIRVFAQHTFAKDNALEKVQLLLHEYQVLKVHSGSTWLLNCRLTRCAADDADRYPI